MTKHMKMAFSSLDEIETLIEERLEEMISPWGGIPTWRSSHFLKPTFPQKVIPSSTQKPSFVKPHFSNTQISPSKFVFHGWKHSLKQWSTWVERLSPEFEPLWRKSFIDQAIKVSTYDYPRYYDLIFALSQRFFPDTNTFVFPWGEASITLEDVMVLGGYSITGDSVSTSYNYKELCEIEDSLHSVRMELQRLKFGKATQQKWALKWMEKRGEFEHEAFLSLWLSRCVFPSDVNDTINKTVFPMAVRLAKGAKIALAPAVLAAIYRDLRLMKEKIESLSVENDENVTKLHLWSPLFLLQLWVWERFPTISPEPNSITIDEPRLARWNKVGILKKDDVGFDLDCAKNDFIWRPFTKPLNNWCVGVALYPEHESWVTVGDLDLESYVRCIRVSELVGLDCIEVYLPHRVSMQFGLDQDVPMMIPRPSSDNEIAWNYNRPIGDAKLYVPSRLFESDVTLQYLQWWKELTFSRSIKVEKDDELRPLLDCGVGIESNQGNGDVGYDSDFEDHLTLTQLFRLEQTNRGNGDGAFKDSHFEIPLSSADDTDHATIRELKLSNSHHYSTEYSENARRESTEDGIESKTRCPSRSPMSTNKKEVETSLQGTPKPDLLTRIARLQRIVDTLGKQ